MDELETALKLLHQAKESRTKTIREYWQCGKTERQGERVEIAIKWCERRKNQLIEIIKHL